MLQTLITSAVRPVPIYRRLPNKQNSYGNEYGRTFPFIWHQRFPTYVTSTPSFPL